MTPPAVSIVMPVYNGGRDLALSLQSMIDQSFADWELLLLDDGSTDGAMAILQRLSDPRLRVFADGQNKGLAVRLNEGIEQARAPLLARMDHDDFSHPERLSKQVEFLVAHPEVDLLGTRCVTMDEADRVFGELPFAEGHAEICRRPWLGFHLAHPTWVGRTSWFRRHRYAIPAPYACEDQELLLRAYRQSRYHALTEPLLAYRVRGTVAPEKLARTRLGLLDVQRKYFKAEGMPTDEALSLLAFTGRRASDAMRSIFPRMRSDMRTSNTESDEQWQSLINRAKDRAIDPVGKSNPR